MNWSQYKGAYCRTTRNCNSSAIEKVGIIQSERKQNPMVPDRQQCRPLAADNQTAKLTNINQEAASMKTS